MRMAPEPNLDVAEGDPVAVALQADTTGWIPAVARIVGKLAPRESRVPVFASDLGFDQLHSVEPVLHVVAPY